MSFKRRLTALLIVIGVLSVGIPAAAADNGDRSVTAVTYNMYLGTDFTEIFSAQSVEEVVAEVAEAYGDVQAGNPAARIAAIADQIEAAGVAHVFCGHFHTAIDAEALRVGNGAFHWSDLPRSGIVDNRHDLNHRAESS